MLRRILVLASLAFCLSFFAVSSAEARIISRGNPYASFNVHGINYGSMRWEREHGHRHSLFGRSYRSSWRRR